jgi:hypothetical protein
MLRRFGLAVGVIVLLLNASPAAAAEPTKTPFTKTSTGVITGVCQFDLNIDQIFTGTEIDFFDSSGTLTRSDYHLVGQDTFTANGKTLVGIPFHAEFQFLFDGSGNLTALILNGIWEKIRLPDGSLYVAAGRGDAFTNPAFFSPTHGNPGNIAGLCAALAP